MSTTIMEKESDFAFYLRFVKPLVLNLSEPSDRALAAAWVQKLRDESVGPEALRIDYLKLLLFVLQRKKLIGIFSENPRNYETLKVFPEANLHIVARDLLEMEEQRKGASSGGDFPPYSTEHSADLLEYSAAQDIPNFGVHAYYAVSPEPLTHWERSDKVALPKSAVSATDKTKPDVISNLSVAASEPTFAEGDGPSKKARKLKSLFKTRRSKSKEKEDEEDSPYKTLQVKFPQLGLISPEKKPTATGPSTPSPLGTSQEVPEKEIRQSPTWGSNLIGVSEPPVRDTVPEEESKIDLDVSEIPYRTPLKESTRIQQNVGAYSPRTPGSSGYPSLPYRTPVPMSDSSEIVGAYSPRTPGSSGYPSLPYRTPPAPYSPALPTGDMSPFFLGSPPPFLHDASLSEVSPVRPKSPTDLAKVFTRDELFQMGLDAYVMEEAPQQSSKQAKAKKDKKKKPATKKAASKTKLAAEEAVSQTSVQGKTPAKALAKRPPRPRGPVVIPTTRSQTLLLQKKQQAAAPPELPRSKRPQTARSRTKVSQAQPSTSTADLQIPASGSRILPPGSQIPPPGFRIPPPGSRIPAPGSRIPPPGSRIPAPGSRIPPADSRIPAPGGSRIPGRSQVPRPPSRLPQPGAQGISSRQAATFQRGELPAESPPTYYDDYDSIPSLPYKTPSPKRTQHYTSVVSTEALSSSFPRAPLQRLTVEPAPEEGLGQIEAVNMQLVQEVPKLTSASEARQSRIPPPGSGIPSGSRIPAVGERSTGIPKSRSRSKIPGTRILKPKPPAERLYSPELPQGDIYADPFFLESPPNFFEEATPPSLSSYEYSSYPSLPYKTPSPKRSPERSRESPQLALNELAELGLTEADLREDIFNLEDIDLSDLAASIDADDQPEFNTSVQSIDQALDEWDRQIAELEREHAEDIAWYESQVSPRKSPPKRKSPLKSPLQSPAAVKSPLKSPLQSPAAGKSHLKPPLQSPAAVKSPLKSPLQSPAAVKSPLKSPLQSPAAVKVPIHPGSPEAQKVITEANKEYEEMVDEGVITPDLSKVSERSLDSFERYERSFAPEFGEERYSPPTEKSHRSFADTEKVAQRQYQKLLNIEMEEEYQRRLQGRRLDVPRTPPVFSKYARAMGEDLSREYDPSEFGVSADADWVSGEQYFKDKNSFSPRVSPRLDETKKFFPGIERHPEAETFFHRESEPSFVDLGDSFDRSPPSAPEDVEKKKQDMDKQLNKKKETTPAQADLPVSTPRSSPFPLRTHRSIRMQTDQGDVSFEVPSPKTPILAHKPNRLYFESPPDEIYGSPGSPLSPEEVKALPAPFDLPKRVQYSPPKVIQELEQARAKRDVVGIMARAEKQLRALESPETQPKQPEQSTPQERQQEKEQRKITSEAINLLDRSIEEELPSPILGSPRVPGWETPPHLRIPPRKQKRLPLLPSQGQSVQVPRGARDIIGQERPPEDLISSSPVQLSPGDYRRYAPTPKRPSPIPPSPHTPSPGSRPSRPPIVAGVKRVIYTPEEGDEDIFEQIVPSQIWDTSIMSPRDIPDEELPLPPLSSPIITPPPRKLPQSPEETPRGFRTRVRRAEEPPYYSKDEMLIARGKTRGRKMVLKSKLSPPRVPALRELPEEYDEEDIPFLAHVEAAQPQARRKERMVIAPSAMETVHESPLRIPQHTTEIHLSNLQRMVREIQEQHVGLPEEPYPEDLIGTQRSGAWSGSEGVMDRAFSERDLPSPIQPPVTVQGWETPPRLRIPKRPPRPPLFPGEGENIKLRPSARNIVWQEIPPEEMQYSPQQLSPGDYERFVSSERQPEASSPCAAVPGAAAPCSVSPGAPCPAVSKETPVHTRSIQARRLQFADMLEDEPPPEDIFESPQKTPPAPKRRPRLRYSPPTDPLDFKLECWQADEPPYYSQDEMVILGGKTAGRKIRLKRSSSRPRVYGLREVPEDYPEEYVPFLAQVEAAQPRSRRTGRMGIISPDMDIIHESPVKVPEFSTQLHLEQMQRHVHDMEFQFAHLPGEPLPGEPLPEDLMGTQQPVGWEESPGLLDRSFTECNLPSPIRPPTAVPGWETPPHLRIPKRDLPPPLFPGDAGNVRLRPGARDIVWQEIPPEGFQYSPVPLSPGDYSVPCPPSSPAPETPPPRSPIPEAPTPGVDKFTPPRLARKLDFSDEGDDLLAFEAPPAEMFESSPRTPPRRRLQIRYSPPTDPLDFKIECWQADEPAYYSQEEMVLVRGNTKGKKMLLKRRSAPPGVHSIRELPEDFNEEYFPFIQQVQSAQPRPRRRGRMQIQSPNMDVVYESPIRVPEFTVAAQLSNLRDRIREIEERYPETPSPVQPPPEDLIGVEGQTDWQQAPSILDSTPTGNLPSPIRPPTVVPGWETPPRLKRPQKPPSSERLKMLPTLRDPLSFEPPPADLRFSPPKSSTPQVFQTPPRRIQPLIRQPQDLVRPEAQFFYTETPPKDINNLSPIERDVILPMQPSPRTIKRGQDSLRRALRYERRKAWLKIEEDLTGGPYGFTPTYRDTPPTPAQQQESPPQVQQEEQDLLNASLDEFEALEEEFAANTAKSKTPGPTIEMVRQMIKTGGRAGQQQRRIERSPTWLETVEDRVIDVPQPQFPRQRPLYSPVMGQVSPEYSPKLVEPGIYAELLDEEYVPQAVWAYESPKTPPESPRTPPQRTSPAVYPRKDLFNVGTLDDEVLDAQLAPRMRSPGSPPTPPRVEDYFSPHTPTSPGSPDDLSQSLQEHEYTDQFFDMNREMMSRQLRIKNKTVTLRGAKRPRFSPIREGLREDSPMRPIYVPEGEFIPVEQFEGEGYEDVSADLSLIDRAVPQEGMPIGMIDEGLRFDSPPRTPRRPVPARFDPGDEVSPQMNLFEEAGGPSLLESTPPEEYYYSPTTGWTPKPMPMSPISAIAPQFRESIQEHDYTQEFFNPNRPVATSTVLSKNKKIRLQRQPQPPGLEDIQEYEEEDLRVPAYVWEGFNAEEFEKSALQRARGSPVFQRSQESPLVYSPGSPCEWGSPYVTDRIPFEGQGSPQMLDTSDIPADLDASFLEEDMAGFRWIE